MMSRGSNFQLNSMENQPKSSRWDWRGTDAHMTTDFFSTTWTGLRWLTHQLTPAYKLDSLWGNVFIIIVLYLEPVMQLPCVARSPGSCHSLSFSLLVSITHNQSHTYYRRQWLCMYRLCGDFPHDGCNTACRCHFVPTQTGFLCTLSHFSVPRSQCNNVLS